MISRTRLSAEPDRDWLYCHAHDSDLSLSFDGRPIDRLRLAISEAEYDAKYHGGVLLPNVKPGKYKLGTGSVVDAIEVVKPPKRATAKVAAGDSAERLQKAINEGKRDITLAPGEHVLTRSVVLPDDSIIRGYGATVRAAAAITPTGDKRPAFLLGNNCTLYGCTFTHDDPNDHLLYGRDPKNEFPRGLVVADCTFRRCGMGFWFQDALIRDCRFERAGATIAASGLWLRCEFVGQAPMHAWAFGFGLGPVAMIDCVFDGTDRGPVFNSGAGPISDFLCVGLACRDIDQTPNGNEILLCEGAHEFSRATILHTRITGCQSMVQMDSPSSGVLMRDLLIDGGGGFCLWGKVHNWLVQDFELRNGAGIYLGPDSSDCRFLDGSIVNWQPGRVNQIWQNPSPIGFKRTIAAWSEGQGNRLERVQLMNATMRGFEVMGA